MFPAVSSAFTTNHCVRLRVENLQLSSPQGAHCSYIFERGVERGDSGMGTYCISDSIAQVYYTI